MPKVGRPRSNKEQMSTIRVRESQRVLLGAMQKFDTEPHHKILSRVLTFYFEHHPVTKKAVRRRLHG
jgi:hypothetical protein